MAAAINRRVVRVGGDAALSQLEPHRERLPDPAPDELQVRVRASSLNYHDYMVATGLIAVDADRVPLSDGAGEVVAVGSDVRGVAVGDQVLGTFFPHWAEGRPTPERTVAITGDSVNGFASDHVVMPAAWFTPMPGSLSYEEAATLPCAGVTAWCALQAGRISEGGTVVIQGSGSVSILALQLASSLGIRTVALTTSKDKRHRFEAIGADYVIDTRKTPDWSNVVRELTDGQGADLVIDVAGGQGFSESIAACRAGGRIATIGFLAGMIAHVNIPDLLLRHIEIGGLAVGSHADQRALVDHINRTEIRPTVDSNFSLDELEAAFLYQQSGRQFGKIVVTM